MRIRHTGSRLLSVAGAFALAASLQACDRSDRSVMNDTAGTSGDDARSTVTISGCMQKGSGLNKFILSDVSADVQQGSQQAYLITDADGRDLDPFVGKHVSITGKLEQNREGVGTSGTTRDDDEGYGETKQDIDGPDDGSARGSDTDDLAKIDLESISETAGACGTVGQP